MVFCFGQNKKNGVLKKENPNGAQVVMCARFGFFVLNLNSGFNNGKKYSKIVIIIFVLFMWSLYSVNIHCQENRIRIPDWIDFYKESLIFHCRVQEVQVDGIYYFRNLTKNILSFVIMYPFPIDKYHPFPDSIRVGNHLFKRKGASIFWTTWIMNFIVIMISTLGYGYRFLRAITFRRSMQLMKFP